MRFILASTSPRRIQMLSDLQLTFEMVSPSIDESEKKGELPASYVKRLALEKALAAQKKLGLEKNSGDWTILAADTTVVLGREILGKPFSQGDAVKMLKKLSGRSHKVLTGFALVGCVGGKIKKHSKVITTGVTFLKKSDDFWRWYVSTGEPMDKAGSYAAQGIGMSFVKKYSGSYANVVGLPLPEIVEDFQKVFGKKAFLEIFRHF